MEYGEPVVLESAERHGAAEEDAVHAWAFAIDAYEVDDGMVMYIGPSRSGNLLEVGSLTGTASSPSLTPCPPETST